MDNTKLSQQELSFSPAYFNQDGILISYGPTNARLWRGEELNIQEFSLIDGLNKVFQTGFTQNNELSPLARLPYIQSHYPDFIGASNTYASAGEFIGLDNEQLSAGNYGYTYLLDTSKENKIEAIPLCEQNLLNPFFVAGYSGEMITEGPDYAILTKPDAKLIIGAVPSAFVAFAFGIDEKSFIKNPAYKGDFRPAELTEISGFTLLVPECLKLQYPNLPLKAVYQCYSNGTEQVRGSKQMTNFFSRPMNSESLTQEQEQEAQIKTFLRPY